MRHRPLAERRRCKSDRPRDRHRFMDAPRHQVADGKMALCTRPKQADFRNNRRRHISESHPPPAFKSQGFDSAENIRPRLQCIRRRHRVKSEVAAIEQHHRHRTVTQRDSNTIDDIAGLAGRKQFAGLAADEVSECQPDRRRCAVDAGDGGFAFVIDETIRRFNQGINPRAGIDVEDPHRRQARRRRHQPGLDGEWTDPRQHIPTIRFRIDAGLVDGHLREQIVDIGSRTRRT